MGIIAPSYLSRPRLWAHQPQCLCLCSSVYLLHMSPDSFSTCASFHQLLPYFERLLGSLWNGNRLHRIELHRMKTLDLIRVMHWTLSEMKCIECILGSTDSISLHMRSYSLLCLLNGHEAMIEWNHNWSWVQKLVASFTTRYSKDHSGKQESITYFLRTLCALSEQSYASKRRVLENRGSDYTDTGV